MEIVDSHAHLDMEAFAKDREEVVRRARDGGINALLCPIELTDPRSASVVLDLCRRHSWISASVGVHPHNAKGFLPSHADNARALAQSGRIAAIGEIGLDHHYDYSPAAAQTEVFRTQLLLAQELGLPVIIHSRNAGPEIIAAIEETRFSKGGVLHCFTEDLKTAGRLLDLGFFISFSGILTYRNASSLRETAAALPIEKLLVETDSPYLVPQPLRNRCKRNEPLFVIETAKALAEIKHVSLDEIAAVARGNYDFLFVKDKPSP